MLSVFTTCTSSLEKKLKYKLQRLSYNTTPEYKFFGLEKGGSLIKTLFLTHNVFRSTAGRASKATSCKGSVVVT
jgi:hypothetical protein